MFVFTGYGGGLCAPLVKGSMFSAAHNVIRAHARAWHTYDRDFRPKQSGIYYLSHCWSIAWDIL